MLDTSTTVNGVKHLKFNRECFERSLVLIAKAQNKDVQNLRSTKLVGS